MKKSTIKKILLWIGLIIVLLVSTFIVWKFGYNKDKVITKNDSQKFADEYQMTNDNIYKYRSSQEIIKILESGTGVVYLGFPECRWCKSYVTLLNDIAKSSNIKNIYYLNILQDRKNNTKDYQRIVELLSKELRHDEEGNPRVYVPEVIIVKDGKIVGHDNETCVVTKEDGTPLEYWTEEKKNALKKKLTSYFKEINENTCTTCN
ncbi:MAG: hypothetical protein RSB41_02160 [Bacilli bacterium]